MRGCGHWWPDDDNQCNDLEHGAAWPGLVLASHTDAAMLAFPEPRRYAALAEMGESLPGATLQVACVYGDLTNCLSERAATGGGSIDIIDVLPIQLHNLRRKLRADAPARLLAMDAMDLKLPDASYNRALVFFLLHEQPRQWRERTLKEVFRVVKPGGKVVIVDYARPAWWHPLRYLFPILFVKLEPFALDLWREEITSWLSASAA